MSVIPRMVPLRSEIYTMKTWNWYDPPVLFPAFLVLLIVGFALFRT